MLNKNIFLLLIALIVSQLASAQITGNVKLVDIYNNLEADHSGIMIAFEPRSGGAVADTAYTDVNGDFSITLVTGQYAAAYKKSNYGSKSYPKGSLPLILTPNFNLPPDRLYKLLPLDTLSGPVSGMLQPFYHYIVNNSITILAGDTLRIPEGSWLDIPSGSTINVEGHLEILGTDSFPAALVSLISTPWSFGYFAVNYFDEYTKVNVRNGGTLYMEKAKIYGGLEFRIFRGAVYLNETSSQADFYNTIDTVNTGDIFNRPGIFLDEGSIYMNETSIGAYIEATTFSYMDINCSYVDASTGWNLSSNAVLKANNSTLRVYNSGSQQFIFNGIDSVIIENSILYGGFVLRNNLAQDTSYYSFKNNSFYYCPLSLSDNIKLNFVNNLGVRIFNGTNPTLVTVDTFSYNLVTYSFNTTYIPPGPVFPFGVIGTVASSGQFDTVDIYGNMYDNYRSIWNDSLWLRPIADSTGLYLDNGDPNILDLDGSRSDRGARYGGCSNPWVLQARGTTIPATDSVYPGDANYDGLCDNSDLLPIGYFFGETGPVRAGASLAWVGQHADPWAITFPNTRNAKHVDCDGDGTIAYPDVDAIYQNYGLTHTIQKQQFGDGLWLQFPSDSIFEGDTVEVKVMLGTNLQPVTGMYGLSFSVTYDAAFITPGSASMRFDSTWLGQDSVDLISFFKEVPSASRYDIALSRTNGVQLSGSGQIGTIIVVINDDILAKDSMTLTTFMDILNITAKDANYSNTVLGGNPATVNVMTGYDRLPSSVENNVETLNISIYPNPAHDKLNVHLPNGKAATLSLYGLDGRKLLQSEATGNTTMDISTLQNGLYVLRIQLGSETLVYKITISR